MPNFKSLVPFLYVEKFVLGGELVFKVDSSMCLTTWTNLQHLESNKKNFAYIFSSDPRNYGSALCRIQNQDKLLSFIDASLKLGKP